MTMQHFVVSRELRVIQSCPVTAARALQSLYRPTHRNTHTQKHTSHPLMVLACSNGIRPTLHNPSMFAWCVRWLSQMPGLFCPQSKTVEELWAALHATSKMLFSKSAHSRK